MHNDGNGLYLDVQKSGSRSWILRTLVRGRRKDIGLGGLSTTTLADAREEAARLRGRARKGEDILIKRRMEKRKTNVPTFEEAAAIVHAEVAPTLKNDHNKVVWLRSLDNHVFPIFGKKTVDAVESADVLRAIAPIWTKTPDMARKTLARIRRVMDWATIQGYRNLLAGDIVVPRPNPCIGIQVALPKQPKDGNHAALSYEYLPKFIDALKKSSAGPSVKLAIEFTILTCTRTSEVLESEWPEFDLDGKVWSIPAKRMKMDEPHKVPLSERCVAILQAAKEVTDSKFVFPSTQKKGEPLSNMSMLRALQRMEGYEEITMHGFRATFKTWAHEKTEFDRLVIEAALAHKVDGIDRHYLRTTFFEQRAKLMEMWATYVIGVSTSKMTDSRIQPGRGHHGTRHV
jgi:integrase